MRARTCAGMNRAPWLLSQQLIRAALSCPCCPPRQVSYTCKAANLYYDAGFNLSQAGTLLVVDHYLSTGYLWET